MLPHNYVEEREQYKMHSSMKENESWALPHHWAKRQQILQDSLGWRWHFGLRKQEKSLDFKCMFRLEREIRGVGFQAEETVWFRARRHESMGVTGMCLEQRVHRHGWGRRTKWLHHWRHTTFCSSPSHSITVKVIKSFSISEIREFKANINCDLNY